MRSARPRRHVRVLGEAVVERLLERRRVEAVGGEADRPADALRLPYKLRSSRLRIDRDDGYAVLQRENEPVEPRRHERIRPRDQALHLGWCSQPDPVDVEARVDGDDSGMASADERVDRRIRQFRQAGRVRLNLADADDRNEGRVAQEHEIRSRRPRAVALPEAVEGVPAVEVFGQREVEPEDRSAVEMV